MEDYYQVLGVPSNAAQEELKERFRFLAHAYHPDKFATAAHKKYAEEAFKKLNAAYQILSNPASRAEYDRKRSSADSDYEGERHKSEKAGATPPYAKTDTPKAELRGKKCSICNEFVQREIFRAHMAIHRQFP